MNKYYKREVSLMNTKIFPRTSLDQPIENPDVNYSTEAKPVEKSDEEIIENVITSLKKIGAKKPGTN